MCDVSVIIATFNRPVLLDRAIRSVAEQHCPTDLEFEIIVVDNTRERSAEQAVNHLNSVFRISITYLNEPRQNIAHARNAGIAASAGSLIAFIDDDEVATREWLLNLVATQKACQADAVFGPVIPEFEKNIPPAWDPNGLLHIRDEYVSTGTTITDGRTGNALFKASCFVFKENFDPAFGLTGGEDTDLLQRLSLSGAKFVWCAEAVVTEFLPPNRCSQWYLLKRAFRSNQCFVRCCRKNSRYHMLTGGYWLANGFTQAALLLLPVLGSAFSRSTVVVRLRMRFFGALGKILSFPIFNYDFYRDSRNSEYVKTTP
jgi:succinoglycan biosynthesis protein ExoM